MGVRTFFLQPFKIPTGSMQPTLYGVITEDLRSDPDFKMPDFFTRLWDVAVRGTIYHQIIAPRDGKIVRIGGVNASLRFANRQTIWVQYDGADEVVPLTVWCGPDDGQNLYRAGLIPFDTQNPYRARLSRQLEFRKGEPIVCFKETTGDHLFVDRVTYNFRQPRRGEIIVFQTKGIERIKDQDQFYIKRLIGLGGETISIGEDRHARVNGRRLDASMPHFENVYGFNPNAEPEDSHYSGHILDSRSDIKTPEDTLEVRPGHYVVFGDNTVSSSDSRYWGDLPEDNVIGKSLFVYWPITARFGWGQQ
jgi:signal peptidase I